MADKVPIVVTVLDGAFLQLNEVGVPLPLCYHMKDKGLLLKSAQWTARQSHGGFSVCFFWPVDNEKAIPEKAKRKRRRKRKRSLNEKKSQPVVLETVDHHLLGGTNALTDSPIDAHCHSGSKIENTAWNRDGNSESEESENEALIDATSELSCAG